MTEVASLLNTVPSGSNILSVQQFKGLSLEPPTKDVIELGSERTSADPVTKEEEWVKKKKTELTTTRQIETRVKRQVVLEDGKVIGDSGPMVSTNTTEDTEKLESETNERRKLGDDEIDGDVGAIEWKDDNTICNLTGNKIIKKRDPNDDHLVRETKEKKVVSREQTDERLETQDIQHFGDFSDESYVKAVNSGSKNLNKLLQSSDFDKQLVSTGPRIVHQSSKSHKTIDTEGTDKRYLVQANGTLVTEKKNTTEHEEIFDEDLPEKDNESFGSRTEIHKESTQKFNKQRDEQTVEYVANGKIIGKETKYVAENEQMERDGPIEHASDWDSLSDRVKKARRQQKMILQQQKEILLGDRKDALTKRPLDFDKEEETRKTETSKWLDSHFGSESISSRDSGDERVIEPTKKSYFNVTIKSNQNTPATSPVGQTNKKFPVTYKTTPEREYNPQKKYFQGVTNWSERRETTPPKTLSSKNFKDELQSTFEKKNNMQKLQQRNEINYQGNGKYTVKNNRRNSREGSDDSRNIKIQKEDLGYISGSRNDIRYGKKQSFTKYDDSIIKRDDSAYVSSPPDSGIRSQTPENQIETRPTVPQRKRAIEKKMRLEQRREEPQPDYSPPHRSRSISPIMPPQNLQSKYFQKTRYNDENHLTPTTVQQQQSEQQPAQKNKVGSAIGNSIRKLVGKIRSASAERKLKLKSKSPSPQKPQVNQTNGSTYQQYNIIDGHIGNQQQQQQQQKQPELECDTSLTSSFNREKTFNRRGSSDIDMNNPKQKFYLGEDPYGGSIFGKENKYDGVRMHQQRSGLRRSEDRIIDHSSRPNFNSNSSTLGRFSQSTNRLPHSAQQDHYRNAQTLPRKLENRHESNPTYHSSKINVSFVNSSPQQNTGPAKPARSYKSLNRSKSFNVHGLNGDENNHSPIYIEKLNRKNLSSSAYKSNPQLNQLRSPSIVNLISRSQKDLSKIDEVEDTNFYNNDKKSVFLRGLQDQAPELYKTLHGNDDSSKVGFYKYRTKPSISPVPQINRDTASVVRRGSSSTEDYSETYRTTSRSDDRNRPGVRNTVQTFSKKTIPTKDGRTTYENTEMKTTTTSRYKGEPLTNLQYNDRYRRN